MKPRFFLLLVLGVVWLSAALPGHAQNNLPNGGHPQSLPTVTLHINNAELTTEVASTPEQQETGLMYRTKMDDNHGMIFLLPTITYADFWMRNTFIPLSVAYIDKNGVILEIHDMKPLDETPIFSKSDQVAYALEANLHWFALNGIKPGDKIVPPPATLGKPGK
ncbi:MAG TPA: DUF192 domain-containing protein [Candidatus Methylacidiphilales bacterium]|nr:DUF192 domain-containing protein [Candidatus Methylacidiphilales bacterium]